MPLWAVVRLSSRPPHTNSVELSKLIGSVYGEGAEAAFLALWRKHIGFFVDYSTGLATGDETKQNAAIESLLGYANDFAAFLSSANPYLPKDAIVDLVNTHAVTLKAVIKAQAAAWALFFCPDVCNCIRPVRAIVPGAAWGRNA